MGRREEMNHEGTKDTKEEEEEELFSEHFS
jgi:hypothetical protein